MNLTPVTFNAPSYWASYYINGDASGLEPQEKSLAYEFLKFEGVPTPCSCGDQTFIATFHYTGLQTEMIEYTSLVSQ